MLLGGTLGVLLRMFLEGPIDPDRPSRAPWRPAAISAIGGFVLGTLTGAALFGLTGDGPSASVGAGLSSALTTYCLINGGARTLIQHGLNRHVVVRAGGNALLGFAAAVPGVVLGISLVS
jgi:fluoride ion exporter CrcB/FEX